MKPSNIICGTGILLATAGALTYGIKENCPNYVGEASLVALLVSGTGLIRNDYIQGLEEQREPEYYI
jgi:hypothetical protein